jgi:hypothetical protein
MAVAALGAPGAWSGGSASSIAQAPRGGSYPARVSGASGALASRLGARLLRGRARAIEGQVGPPIAWRIRADMVYALT